MLSRFKRRGPAIALAASLLALACPALADQFKESADGGTVACSVSARELTRFALIGDQFASVSKISSGYWFYCTRPKPPERQEPLPESQPSATSRLDAITAELRELKARAILEPSPANVTAYIRFQRRQLDQAILREGHMQLLRTPRQSIGAFRRQGN